eukprot:scaffold19960_cov129-Isochrysis_galbana.AAC.2
MSPPVPLHKCTGVQFAGDHATSAHAHTPTCCEARARAPFIFGPLPCPEPYIPAVGGAANARRVLMSLGVHAFVPILPPVTRSRRASFIGRYI